MPTYCRFPKNETEIVNFDLENFDRLGFLAEFTGMVSRRFGGTADYNTSDTKRAQKLCPNAVDTRP